MALCTECGQQLGIGRFCTNCGHPVDPSRAELESWRTDTAERPRVVPPIEPLPSPGPPDQARFPLYADDVAPPPPSTNEPATSEPERIAPVVLPPPPPVADRPTRTHRGGPPGWLPWLVGFVVMVMVAGFGAWLLFSGGDDDPQTAQAPPASSPTEEEEPTPEEDPSPSEPSPTESADPEPFAGDLAPFSTVSAPAAAAPGQDANGEVVRYVADNMIDGIPETAWRMSGDGTGESITFRLERPATLSEVGLINGYAKVARDGRGLLDWYHGNRRILAVEWTFDDGTVLTQQLRDTTLFQTVRVKKVETESVTVRLLRVTAPGRGRASRNYTAISEVTLLGTSP